MSNYKMLVFDVDKSLSTLGNEQKQVETLGIKPIQVFGGLDVINNYLDLILKVSKVPISHPLLGDQGEDVVISFNDKGEELGVNILAIDSLSMLGTVEREMIKKKEGIAMMDMRSWGLYGDSMIKFINKISKCSFPVVVTTHIKRDQDENGSFIEVPALKGSAATECGRYFDVIAYTKLSKDAQGRTTEYSWIVNGDGRHAMAKNRGNILGNGIIPQNLNYVISKYAEAGIHDPKILIIGDTGQGKSWCFGTINQPIADSNEEEATEQ